MCLKINVKCKEKGAVRRNTPTVDSVSDRIWVGLTSAWHWSSQPDKLKIALPDMAIDELQSFISHILSNKKQIVHIGRHPVSMLVMCPTAEAATDLWFSVKSGSLDAMCQAAFANSLRKQFNLKALNLAVTTDHKEVIYSIREMMQRSE